MVLGAPPPLPYRRRQDRRCRRYVRGCDRTAQGRGSAATKRRAPAPADAPRRNLARADLRMGLRRRNCRMEPWQRATLWIQREEALGQSKNTLLQTSVPGSSFAESKQELLDGGNWSGELTHRTKDGRQLTVESRIELVPLGGHRLVLESTRDVTERKAWEARQKLLLGELTHRV